MRELLQKFPNLKKFLREVYQVSEQVLQRGGRQSYGQSEGGDQVKESVQAQRDSAAIKMLQRMRETGPAEMQGALNEFMDLLQVKVGPSKEIAQG